MPDPTFERPAGLKNRFILVPYYLEKSMPDISSILQGAEGILPDTPLTGHPPADLPAIYRPLAQRVAAIAATGARPVTIAGDCCTALAVESGLHRAGLSPLVVWFDAHGDFNTWETSPSGFLGGMPLAMLVGRGEQTYLEALSLPPLSEDRVVLAGARQLDPGEAAGLAASQVIQIPDVIDLIGYDWPDRPIHVHFDVDVVNPQDVPAVDYPTPGGPTATEIDSVLRGIAATGKLAAVSVAAWNPVLDPNGATRKSCLRLLSTLLDQEV